MKLVNGRIHQKVSDSYQILGTRVAVFYIAVKIFQKKSINKSMLELPEKIVQNLKKSSDEYKLSLNKKYVDHSSWLQNEMRQIIELISQNPREQLKLKNDKDFNFSQGVEELDEIPAPLVSRSTQIFDKGSNQKRKSPDASVLRESPDQKRSLTKSDDDIKTGDNKLPTNLGILTKEQLLQELERRDVFTFSMKNLKKDLVDALQNLLDNMTQVSSKEKDLESVVIDMRTTDKNLEDQIPIAVNSNKPTDTFSTKVEIINDPKQHYIQLVIPFEHDPIPDSNLKPTIECDVGTVPPSPKLSTSVKSGVDGGSIMVKNPTNVGGNPSSFITDLKPTVVKSVNVSNSMRFDDIINKLYILYISHILKRENNFAN
jgi:hypothetical protein